MKLYVATHNSHKIREISEILPAFDIEPDDPEGVEENAPDFAGNALIKVRAIAAAHRGEWCMADDSGLEVESLDGAPGVRSARYAGEPSNTPNNNALLLKNLQGVENRRANFTCAVALIDPKGREHVAIGKCFGHIAEKPSGAAGFGYDPLFVPDGYDKSFADLTAEEKNAISHRGRALEIVRKLLARETAGVGAWLRLFRVVNLPTVPGDVLCGAAAALASGALAVSVGSLRAAAWASAASVFLYMYGLVDNDILGAETDKERPISEGSISVAAARFARGFCWGAVLLLGALGNLPPAWWVTALALFVAIAVYNRTKASLVMGVCRGLNVLCGAAAVSPVFVDASASPTLPVETFLSVGAVAAIWTFYIAAVTKYSEGEETSPSKKRMVGFLIGALMYLQLGALVYFTLKCGELRYLLAAGAILLLLLRALKRVFPKVSAS